MRRRLLVLLVLAACAVGVTTGLVLSGGSARAAGPPGVVARGTFHSLGWGTNGGAVVVRRPSGALILRLGADFRTQRAPALWVEVGRYSGLHSSAGWTTVARLQNWFGAQTYHLDRAPSAGDSVIVFCGKCDRAFGAARLRFG